MAVYTDVGEAELSAFLGRYDVGTLLSYKGIAEGTENTNFLLRAERGSFILTLYERRVKAEDLPFFLGLMEHLANKGLSCPLPVRARDGALTGTLAGREAALITFLEGVWMRRPNVAQCREVGAALAALHLAGADFSLVRPNALSVAGWRTLWDDSRERADEVESGLRGEIEADLQRISAAWPHNLPSGVIHADLFPDNVFFLGNTLSGLIDFYFACNEFYAYDLAISLNAWCFEPDLAFNITKGRSLLSGYRAVRPLSQEEIGALPLLAHGAALRFLLTRLFDWLTIPDGPLLRKRDPMEYIRKLRFHRQVASSAEYGLP